MAKDFSRSITRFGAPTAGAVAISSQPAVPASASAPTQAWRVGNRSLEMPEDAMYGRLGKLAKDINLPLGAAYPALLGVFSIIPDMDVMCGVRTNEYVAMLGESGSGKNVSIDRAMDVLGVHAKDNPNFALSAPTGARILLQLVGDKPAGGKNSRNAPRVPGPRKLLLRSNEISDCFLAARAETSTLINRLTDFWDNNVFVLPDGKGSVCTADCRLSWIGGLPTTAENTERFLDIFGKETGHGLYDRFLFGYVSEPIDFDGKHAWQMPDTFAMPVDLSDYTALMPQKQWVQVARFDDDAWQLYRQWNVPAGHSRRLALHAKKVAVLSASANLESSVSRACMEAAIKFVEWQCAVRTVFGVGVAENLEGAFSERALDTFERLTREGKAPFVPLRLSHDLKWGRKYGERIVLAGIRNFEAAFTIVPHFKKQANGSWIKSETAFYLNPSLYGGPEYERNRQAVEKNRADYNEWFDSTQKKDETAKEKAKRLKSKMTAV